MVEIAMVLELVFYKCRLVSQARNEGKGKEQLSSEENDMIIKFHQNIITAGTTSLGDHHMQT
jgi:hypothetical protein